MKKLEEIQIKCRTIEVAGLQGEIVALQINKYNYVATPILKF